MDFFHIFFLFRVWHLSSAVLSFVNLFISNLEISPGNPENCGQDLFRFFFLNCVDEIEVLSFTTWIGWKISIIEHPSLQYWTNLEDNCTDGGSSLGHLNKEAKDTEI